MKMNLLQLLTPVRFQTAPYLRRIWWHRKKASFKLPAKGRSSKPKFFESKSHTELVLRRTYPGKSRKIRREWSKVLLIGFGGIREGKYHRKTKPLVKEKQLYGTFL